MSFIFYIEQNWPVAIKVLLYSSLKPESKLSIFDESLNRSDERNK